MRLCEVSRRRFRCQDVVRILILPRYFPQICSCKESAQGRGPMSGEVGGRGGIRRRLILITLVENLHRLRMRKGGNTKGGSEVKSFPLLLAPPPPLPTPLLTSYDAQTLGRVSDSCCGKISKLAELQNSLICRLQRLPLLSQRAHWIRSKVAL